MQPRYATLSLAYVKSTAIITSFYVNVDAMSQLCKKLLTLTIPYPIQLCMVYGYPVDITRVVGNYASSMSSAYSQHLSLKKHCASLPSG